MEEDKSGAGQGFGKWQLIPGSREAEHCLLLLTANDKVPVFPLLRAIVFDSCLNNGALLGISMYSKRLLTQSSRGKEGGEEIKSPPPNEFSDSFQMCGMSISWQHLHVAHRPWLSGVPAASFQVIYGRMEGCGLGKKLSKCINSCGHISYIWHLKVAARGENQDKSGSPRGSPKESICHVLVTR